MDNLHNDTAIKFTVDLPYPTITPTTDLRTARMLLDDFAGQDSELTGVNQYIYQHLVTGEYKDLSAVLKGIAIVEMKHFEMLGEAIVNLGGDPVFTSSRGRPWTALYLKYIKNPKLIILMNIQGEKAGIKGYRQSIEMTNNPQVKKLLERIILDEELHVQNLEKMLVKFEHI